MKNLIRYFFILLLLTTPAFGQFDQFDGPGFGDTDQGPVSVSATWNKDGVKPGDTITLAVTFDITKPYHVNANSNDPDLDGIATSLKLEKPSAGIISSTPLYPAPHKLLFGPEGAQEEIEVFSDKTIIYMTISVDKQVPVGKQDLLFQVNWQACDDQACLLPAQKDIVMELNVVEKTVAVQAVNEDAFKDIEKAGLLKIPFFGWDFYINPNNTISLLLLAAVGGFLLNLTPCVLPMIPIKIMSLSQGADHHGKSLLLGSIMCLGIVVFWLGIGSSIAFISGFDAINKLFQFSAFTLTIGVFIAAMAIGMMGWFTVKLPQAVYMINPSQNTMHGSFLFGIMTAVLSTPCTAPFMGATVAWATKQDNPQLVLSTFAAIGSGMALPYLILAAFPKLVDHMPRTGPASELVKQVMGLLMLAAAAFFMGTGLSGILSSPPDPPSEVYWWAVGLIILAAGLWLAKQTIKIKPAAGKLTFFVAVGLIIAIAGGWVGYSLTRPSPVNWIYYTPERQALAHEQNKVVVLDFTAIWCLNCKTLEKTVLQQKEVYEALNDQSVAPIKVDITSYEPAKNKLTEIGNNTIPLLIIYDIKGKEIFRSDLYNATQVLEAIQKAKLPKNTDATIENPSNETQPNQEK